MDDGDPLEDDEEFLNSLRRGPPRRCLHCNHFGYNHTRPYGPCWSCSCKEYVSDREFPQVHIL